MLSYTSSVVCVFMARCITDHTDNSVLTFSVVNPWPVYSRMQPVSVIQNVILHEKLMWQQGCGMCCTLTYLSIYLSIYVLLL